VCVCLCDLSHPSSALRQVPVWSRDKKPRSFLVLSSAEQGLGRAFSLAELQTVTTQHWQLLGTVLAHRYYSTIDGFERRLPPALQTHHSHWLLYFPVRAELRVKWYRVHLENGRHLVAGLWTFSFYHIYRLGKNRVRTCWNEGVRFA